ncbi:MAG TPA: rod shape-determining protein MreD [Anaerolineae bacterium]|nr:rod shape-determining protein MreD [Anaerolineae bacterium]HQK12623.1 rod shape-determining protein MreD [Anaerolineae bacterium]
MSLYFGIPILLLAAVLQSVWLENIQVLGGRPDLVLLLAVTWGIIRGANEGAVWGFVGGIFCDLLSGGEFGMWTFALTAVGFLAGQTWVHALGPTLIRLALMSALGTLIGHGILLGTMAVLGYSVNVGQSVQKVAGPAALLNFLLSPFAFTFLVWFHRRSQPRWGGAGL